MHWAKLLNNRYSPLLLYFVIVDSSTFWYPHKKRYGQRMRRDTSHVRYVIVIPFMPISFEFFYDFALSCLALPSQPIANSHFLFQIHCINEKPTEAQQIPWKPWCWPTMRTRQNEQSQLQLDRFLFQNKWPLLL